MKQHDFERQFLTQFNRDGEILYTYRATIFACNPRITNTANGENDNDKGVEEQQQFQFQFQFITP